MARQTTQRRIRYARRTERIAMYGQAWERELVRSDRPDSEQQQTQG